MARRRLERRSAPPVIDGQGCTIVFGANARIKKVLMQLSVSANMMIFSPEEARDVASKLLHYAEVADGKEPA